MFLYVCVCVFFCMCVWSYALSGLASSAAWPESRPPAEGWWECGEFGRDQLIKLSTLALSCFPCRQGTSDQEGSHTSTQRQWGFWNIFSNTHTHTHALNTDHLTSRSGPFLASLYGVLILTSFSSPTIQKFPFEHIIFYLLTFTLGTSVHRKCQRYSRYFALKEHFLRFYLIVLSSYTHNGSFPFDILFRIFRLLRLYRRDRGKLYKVRRPLLTSCVYIQLPGRCGFKWPVAWDSKRELKTQQLFLLKVVIKTVWHKGTWTLTNCPRPAASSNRALGRISSFYVVKES